MFPKRHKYNAKKTSVNGITFDSTLESKIYLLLLANGFTPSLQNEFILQEGFRFDGEMIRPIAYRADFVINHDNKVYVVDAKGMILSDAKLKAKMMLARGYPVIYLTSLKKAQQFCELVLSGKSPAELRRTFNKKTSKK
jgi:hypothetical protein